MRLVLLHALVRSGRSMQPLRHVLEADGHTVDVIEYPSRKHRLNILTEMVADEIRRRKLDGGGPDVGFVTHSMGGIVLRALPRELRGFKHGRSVLLGPPLNGSIIAEHYAGHPVVGAFNGPALEDLAPVRVAKLPRVAGPFAVVAGTTWSPFLPAAHILRKLAPGEPSDSTVLVRETMSPHAADHAVIRGVHTFLPSNRRAQELVRAFLSTGTFGGMVS